MLALGIPAQAENGSAYVSIPHRNGNDDGQVYIRCGVGPTCSCQIIRNTLALAEGCSITSGSTLYQSGTVSVTCWDHDSVYGGRIEGSGSTYMHCDAPPNPTLSLISSPSTLSKPEIYGKASQTSVEIKALMSNSNGKFSNVMLSKDFDRLTLVLGSGSLLASGSWVSVFGFRPSIE